MDLNTFRSLMTLLGFLMFVGMVFWAYSGARKAAFREAANLPFADDDAIGDETGASRADAGDAIRRGNRQ